MVSRDINMRFAATKKVSDRLCFQVPTKKQDYLNNTAMPYVEPLTNLRDYQEYNSIESIQKRAAQQWESKTGKQLMKHKRRKMDFISLEPINTTIDAPLLPVDLQMKQDALSPRFVDVPFCDVSLKAPNERNYGICSSSKLRNEMERYEGETDIMKVIEILYKYPEIKFFYLTHNLPKKHIDYHYYNLRVASYSNINKNDYYTISTSGCTHIVIDDEMEFTTLARFEFEYKMFTQMMKLPLFKRFRIWKAFLRWQKVIRYAKIVHCQRFLEQHLFIANPTLRPALLNLREMCYGIAGMTLCRIERGKTSTLLEFLGTQMSQLAEAHLRLVEFHELIKEIIRSACRTALLEYGFLPDDYFHDENDIPETLARNIYDVDELIDACKLGAKRLQLASITYDTDHPLVGSAMKPVALALKQMRNNRCKLERRVDKIKLQGPGARASIFLQCSDNDVFADPSEKMSFTDQANKRNKCKRLTCFIRLIDYLTLSTLHVLTKNSIFNLNQCFIEELSFIPTAEVIETLRIQVDLQLHPEENDSVDDNDTDVIAMPSKPSQEQTNVNAAVISTVQVPVASAVHEQGMGLREMELISGQAKNPPFFLNELILQDHKLVSIPSEEQFIGGIADLVSRFQEIMMTSTNLVPDVYFDAFTRPFINNKFEDKTCGLGPLLKVVFEEDLELQNLISSLQGNLHIAFKAISLYINTFAEMIDFYKTNELITNETVEAARHAQAVELIGVEKIKYDVEFFREQLATLHRQVIMTTKIPDNRPIGLFAVDTTVFKNTMKPSPLRCLDCIYDLLPKIARTEVDRLSTETQDAEYTLSLEMGATVDYVNHLQFLRKIQLRIESLEQEADAVRSMYELIDIFQVPAPPEDFAVYQTLLPSIERTNTAIDRALAERDGSVDKFFASIDRDVGDLMNDIRDAKQAVSNPMLLDLDKEREVLLNELSRVNVIVEELQLRAATYKNYQKSFKDLSQQISGTSLEDQILNRPGVRANNFLEWLGKLYPNIIKLEQPRFLELESVANELMLKQLLWDSLEEWDSKCTKWFECEFANLNPEDVTSTTMKFIKFVQQLEKGLPSNTVVPLLRYRVDQMRSMLPAISDLRNPALQARHWALLEDLINFKMKDLKTPLNLGKLIQLKAFEKAEEIQEISGMASSEASLEGLLKKVEDSWKATEFVVLPYKNNKDIFILGGTDEIQQLWDDSNINISTIASSKHVGPIKGKVDEWIDKLQLFGETIEEWLNCQRGWMYLESIFSAPDIQRQLPSEAKSFMALDKSFKDVMRKVQKVPLAMRSATQPGLLDTFLNNNTLLDQIQKCLEAYLESKRAVFPRFYFLSNDELLEILAQTRNPLAVQPHLQKCFDAISKLDFASNPEYTGTGSTEPEYTNDILGMLSPEGEWVSLGKGLKARGNVEDWLGKVEEAMVVNLRKSMKQTIADVDTMDRETWLKKHTNQITLTVEQLIWARDINNILDESFNTRLKSLIKYEKISNEALNSLAKMVRSPLPKLIRMMFCSLITIDVHARDMVAEMVVNKVDSVNNFDWQRQLRYYWDSEIDNCVVHMSTSRYVYGYEYLGASPRLVITPLTDRCYLCLMGALQLDLGGAPAGPAGTGKTETTKDLAKGLAKQCVVFNCSDGLDYKMMGRFFSGLAQSGAWCCFDEFNRIDIEVLSVIAQQLITIRTAKASKVSRFLFEGREIKLCPSCAAFITMNPGYAGRTELPDNLKALFRPISMMVPDYKLIAEVILYSEGFESSSTLALKMTQMYKLCSEQLSKQDHYDFGMRALKSVLVMAGALKRENADKPEDVVLIRALRDSNLPKFLVQDGILFTAILKDLFPGVKVPDNDYGRFQSAIEETAVSFGLQVVKPQVSKVIQFYETLLVRHGVMLVGPTGGGKTTVLKILAKTLKNLHSAGLSDEFPDYQPVKVHTLNPKSITMGELYGEINNITMEWHDGLMAFIVRKTCVDSSKDHQWIVCDGPVDALWIENMNTVLDDNKMLCLANSERIKLTQFVHMLFEVADLAVASPATVSRCGMVYVDPTDLGWLPYVQTWMNTLKDKIRADVLDYLLLLFKKFVDLGLTAIMKLPTVIPQVPISRVQTMCKLLEVSFTHTGAPEMEGEILKMQPIIAITFVFAFLWGLAGNVSGERNPDVDSIIRNIFEDCSEARMPTSNDLWSCYVDNKFKRFENWEKLLPTFVYNKSLPFFNCLVPTIDTVRYGYIFQRLLSARQSVLFTGETGVGKTAVARSTLDSICDQSKYVPVFINFSAQTSSNRTQEMIVSKLEKRRKNVLGAPKTQRLILFVDDLNMPKLDTYGSQPPIELLRQMQDFGGFYDRDKLNWIKIEDVTLSAACGPPGGGRNPVTSRLIRHFSVLTIPTPSEFTLKSIFNFIMQGFMMDYQQTLRPLADSIVNGAVDIYGRLAAELLPTPTKSHYVFNLRDLSKCIQGILQTNPISMRDKGCFTRLFYHECTRVFHDRLVDDTDRMFFNTILSETANRYFNEQIESNTFATQPYFFGDFMSMGASRKERLYEEIAEISKLKVIMQEYLDDYNMVYSKDIKLVFFTDAIQHVCRIARMIRQDRGNALLVGVGGTGKQSLTRLAAHINSYTCFQIELSRSYGYESFHEDLKKLYTLCGVQRIPTVFLFTDNQIIMEEFLEDLNNILNSGEVPGLFKADEYEKLIIGCRPSAKEAGIPEGNRDGIYNYCIEQVRNNLHLVLSMSPVGSAFRSRCRMFPSLVNCCTIDWLTEWPEEALYSVVQSAFQHVELEPVEIKDKIAEMCTITHLSVSSTANQFFAELRRHYYTTPTSYLELISTYKKMLNDRKNELKLTQDKFKNGLYKIQETNELVTKMEIELTAMRPKLETKQKDTEVLMIKLGEDQEKADVVRIKVKEDEMNAKQKAMETQAIADDAQRDLDAAMPALNAATKALEALDKNDISEMRVFTKPPLLVQTVMEAVCLMLGQKTDWASAKTVLSDSNFLRKLAEYPKDDISDLLLKKLKKYIDNPEFLPDVVEKVSKACKSLCMWVLALELYARIFRTVEPKRKRLNEANQELDSVVLKLREKQSALKAVEEKIVTLQAIYNKSVSEKKALEHNLALTAARLKRAGKLTAALSDEKGRWEVSISLFDDQLSNIVGDVFIAAACVAYYGAFTTEYRERLVNGWVAKCIELELPVTENVGLFSVLGDSFELREWNSQGLPRDQVSTENAVLVTRSRRWPLMIDPQEQANRWIRNKETENGIRIVKSTDSTMLRILETCIRVGCPMLLEDVGEALDPSIEPILLKQTFVKGGRLLIRLGDSDVDYDKNFKLYITTKLPNPHYLPEVAIKVTLINFTVTPLGLEDQLLSEVTRLERPELEEQRVELIVAINNDKTTLQQTEDRILKLLFESEGNILDNEALINTLNESKTKSAEINKRLVEAEATENMILTARSKYNPIAARGSVLYFVIALLGDIDPMYQFSLKYFKSLFNLTIEKCSKDDESDRTVMLINAITLATYNNVARGLFARDKLVFSFLLCAKIMIHQGTIQQNEWDYLITCMNLKDRERLPQPSETLRWLGSRQWKSICDLTFYLPDIFGTLPNDVSNKKIFVNLCSAALTNLESKDSLLVQLTPDYMNLPDADWDTKLSLFQKAIMVTAIKGEAFVAAVTQFVLIELGRPFIEAPAIDLPLLYEDMDNVTPLVFVLSPGSDPMSQFQRFAKDMNYGDRIQAISLGQGQGPMAEKLMDKCASNGDWVFLQNCHLAASWMIRMEETIKNRAENSSKTNPSFRLFLSSMPSKTFPIAVLQNAVKVTNEPPKGIKANLRRALNDIAIEYFEDNILEGEWRKIVFGMCLFHAVILERKKFGPLGWNIPYEFNDSDRECALLNLNLFCGVHGIAWDALTYITAEITYGGRVTDAWDQRCLRVILKRFFTPEMLEPNYSFSESGLFYPPEFKTLIEFQNFVETFPIQDPTELFAMHENANLVFQQKETLNLLHKILEIQPKAGGVEQGKTPDEVIFELAGQILAGMPNLLDVDKAKPDHFVLDSEGRVNSLTTVLTQEIDRYNSLLKIIKISLVQLQKAVKGFVVMSEELEHMYASFLINEVPEHWMNKAYPSLKPLSSWVKDLLLRVEFINQWMSNGQPKSFWISGFFFPQGFLTGILQNYARKYVLPIDHLSFDFHVLRVYRDQGQYSEALSHIKFGETLPADDEIVSPTDGVLIHGLFMDGFRWDEQSMMITDSIVGETLPSLPIVHMKPDLDFTPDPSKYISPLYKTSIRAGVLSTTGHSTNFVVDIALPQTLASSYWIEKGAALLTMCDD